MFGGVSVTGDYTLAPCSLYGINTPTLLYLDNYPAGCHYSGHVWLEINRSSPLNMCPHSARRIYGQHRQPRRYRRRWLFRAVRLLLYCRGAGRLPIAGNLRPHSDRRDDRYRFGPTDFLLNNFGVIAVSARHQRSGYLHTTADAGQTQRAIDPSPSRNELRHCCEMRGFSAMLSSTTG